MWPGRVRKSSSVHTLDRNTNVFSCIPHLLLYFYPRIQDKMILILSTRLWNSFWTSLLTFRVTYNLHLKSFPKSVLVSELPNFRRIRTTVFLTPTRVRNPTTSLRTSQRLPRITRFRSDLQHRKIVSNSSLTSQYNHVLFRPFHSRHNIDMNEEVEVLLCLHIPSPIRRM